MARLRVRLRGKPIYDITLAEDRSYIAGRKEDCDIVLQPEKGISREHFKVSFVNGAWQVEVVSRYGEVIHNGEQIQELALSHGVVFSLPPYEFDYLNTTDEVAKAESSSNLPAVTGVHQVDDFGGSEEKTVIGVAPLSAYIKIVDVDNEAQELIRLDAGDSWVAGRDSSCHIHIRDPRVSRRQFEIRRAGSQYVILDLGSVNGTLVNGSPISSTEPTPIRSGDAISVLTNYLYFELHDAHFQSRLDMVDLPPPNPLVPMGSNDSVPAEYQHHSPHEIMPYQNHAGLPTPYQDQHPMGPVAPPTPVQKPKFDFQKNRPKLIIGAVILLLVAYLFSGDDGGSPSPSNITMPGSPMEIFNKLKPEQQALVRQRYKDAKNLYMQGKYQLAQDEIIKIQELVPDYEDIKEIERLSKEAIFIQDQQRRQEELEKARAETEEKIQAQTAICQKKVHANITMAEMDECLSPILQFDPQHPKILDLKTQVESLTAQREAKEAERMAYQSQVSKLRGMYSRAQEIQKKGKPLDAIDAFEKVANSSLPDPSGLKSASRQAITVIRQQMNSKTASLQVEAQKFYEAQNLKGAILALRKARMMDPSNPELPEKIEQYTTELRKQMMNIYQEGILEESFGNVDGGESKAGAKDKWKKILELDVPDGEYYKKAFIKLKKYGAL